MKNEEFAFQKEKKQFDNWISGEFKDKISSSIFYLEILPLLRENQRLKQENYKLYEEISQLNEFLTISLEENG